MTRAATIAILIAVGLGLIAWDVWVYVIPPSGDTISEVLLDAARNATIIPFAFGVVCGHSVLAAKVLHLMARLMFIAVVLNGCAHARPNYTTDTGWRVHGLAWVTVEDIAAAESALVEQTGSLVTVKGGTITFDTETSVEGKMGVFWSDRGAIEVATTPERSCLADSELMHELGHVWLFTQIAPGRLDLEHVDPFWRQVTAANDRYRAGACGGVR